MHVYFDLLPCLFFLCVVAVHRFRTSIVFFVTVMRHSNDLVALQLLELYKHVNVFDPHHPIYTYIYVYINIHIYN